MNTLFVLLCGFLISSSAFASDVEILSDLSQNPDVEYFIFDSQDEATDFKTLYPNGEWIVDEEGNEYFIENNDSEEAFDVFSKFGKSSRGCNLQNGVASWYGPGFNGRKTANGETFNQNALTAAHKTLKFGSIVRVTYKGRSVDVRINDAGPFVRGRVIDLSKAAAEAIGLIGPGHAPVTLTLVRCGNG